MVTKAGLPLTLNAVIHRANLHQVGAFIELALELGARRLEVAHTQYYGWALANRAALMPRRKEVEESIALVEGARTRLKGQLVIDMVVARLLRALSEALRGRLGADRHQYLALGQGPALPCGGIDSGPRVLERARALAGRDLA